MKIVARFFNYNDTKLITINGFFGLYNQRVFVYNTPSDVIDAAIKFADKIPKEDLINICSTVFTYDRSGYVALYYYDLPTK